MAVIFSSRKLIPSFTHRVVVGESSGILTSQDELVFRVSVDFGVNGRLALFTTVPLLRNDLHKTVKQLDAHIRNITALINGLLNFNDWAIQGEDEQLILTIPGKRPFMLVGDRTERKIKLGVYGEELQNLSIVVDSRKDPGVASLARKVWDIAREFEEHVKSIKEIDVINFTKFHETSALKNHNEVVGDK